MCKAEPLVPVCLALSASVLFCLQACLLYPALLCLHTPLFLFHPRFSCPKASRYLALVMSSRTVCKTHIVAGQGYIWLAHRPPDSPAWGLAAHSQQLWRDHVLQSPGLTPAEVEWQV